jgi:uncharacterized NAD(P)/FAD-binding protein YdhS
LKQDFQPDFDWIIIGAGFSATAVAHYLSQKKFEGPRRALLIESTFEPALGLAYSAPSSAHILNVPTKGMSIDCQDDLHFLTWCNSSGYAFTESTFAPRQIYGQYLKDCLSAAQKRNSNLTIEVIKGCAKNIQSIEAAGLKTELNDGREFLSRAVVVAIGNSPALEEAPHKEPAKLKTPWNKVDLIEASKTDEVAIIGTSLTAVDTVLALEDLKFKGRYTLLSRRRLLPHAHDLAAPKPSPEVALRLRQAVTSGNLSYRCAEFRKLVAEGDNWQSLFNELRPITPQVWKSLNVKSQRTFLRHLRPYWDAHRHRIPKDSLDTILRLQEAERLRVLAGHIKSLTGEANKLAIVIEKRGVRTSIAAEAAFDCRGIWSNISKHQSPLIKSLLSSGLASSDHLGLGFVTGGAGQLMSTSGQRAKNIFTLGTLRRGELWETTAVREVRAQAFEIAECLQ